MTSHLYPDDLMMLMLMLMQVGGCQLSLTWQCQYERLEGKHRTPRLALGRATRPCVCSCGVSDTTILGGTSGPLELYETAWYVNAVDANSTWDRS